LLIPQEDRDELLYDGEREVKSTGISENVLLSEFIGEVSPSKKIENKTHRIASVNLFSTSSTDVVNLANNLIISKSLFKDRSQMLSFNLDDVRDVKEAELYILVGDKNEGSLIIVLNGMEIYNKELPSNSQDIISLPLDYLQERNTIELLSSGSFLRKGEYELRHVKLRKSFDLKNRAAERTFSIPSSEMKDIENAVLSYSVYCNLRESNSLRFYLNDNLIYSDVPFCNLKKEEIEIDEEYLKMGVNVLRFGSDGDYIIEGMKLKTVSREAKFPEYYFNLELDDYKDVKTGKLDVMLSFDFSVSDDRKVMILDVNGNEVRVDTNDDSYYVAVSDYVEEGDNLIKLDAKNTFEIIEFKVELA